MLVDVGLARRAHEASDAAGTPGFAAPESFTEAEESSATDVYGLATTTYAMLTGGPPFGGGEIITVVKRQMFEALKPVTEIRGDLPRAVDDVLRQALAPHPADRHPSATAFAEALADALADDDGEDRRLPRPTPVFQMPEVSISPPSRTEVRPIRRPLSPIALVHEEPALIDSVGESRGVFFSIARRLIAHMTGDEALDAIAERSSVLAAVLSSSLHPNDWYPVEQLIELFAEVALQVGDAGRFAHRLGRSVINATLGHVFGADPEIAGPVKVVRAAPSFWPRYHSWGTLELVGVEPGAASLRLTGSIPNDDIIGALVGGMLQRIPQSAGGGRVSLERDDLTFQIRWKTP